MFIGVSEDLSKFLKFFIPKFTAFFFTIFSPQPEKKFAMNKPLSYSKPLMGRAIAGKKHLISDPENTLWTVKKYLILLLLDTLELKMDTKLIQIKPFYQLYQGFKQVKPKLSKPVLTLFFHQIFTKSSPFSHHLTGRANHE